MTGTPDTRARILVESPHEDVRSEHAFVLRKAGYDVTTCAGPDGPCGHCPLVDDGRCMLVDTADVVITTPHLRRSREILAALTGSTSPVVIVEGGAPELEREQDVVGDARVLLLPVRADELIGAVEDAVRSPALCGEPFGGLSVAS